MTTLPTPEELEAEALDLEQRAAKKERHSAASWSTDSGSALLLIDVRYLRAEAASKRAKAERMRTQAALDSLE